VLRVCGKGTKVVLLPLPSAVDRAMRGPANRRRMPPPVEPAHPSDSPGTLLRALVTLAAPLPGPRSPNRRSVIPGDK
jgi:hypothetical protein